jgi:nitrogen fixation protein NifM
MHHSQQIAYIELKTAQSLFGKPVADLAPNELHKVRGLAGKQRDLEERVLRSAEARQVMVPASSLDDALAEIRKRYADDAEFQADLRRAGLDPAGFRDALERELKVDAVLEKVGARATTVSDIDVDLYYAYHPEQFRRPETRRARHILVTVNPALPDNAPDAARRRVEAIAARLAKDPKRFEEQAMKHSECPTALHGGLLGEVPAGQLYAELDAALFGLRPGEISGILESPLGYHLVRCEAINPAGALTQEQAREPIRGLLAARRKRICQQAWIKQLAPLPADT